jgi:hypothetical protein
MKRLLILAGLVLETIACGSTTTDGPGSGGSGGTAGSSAGSGGSCEDFASPALDKSCATDDDCFAGVHTLDCCGSQVVLGYNLSAQSSFDEYEADCTARALCRCAPAEPTIEGGHVTSDIELRRAVCSGGQCLGTGPVNVGDP